MLPGDPAVPLQEVLKGEHAESGWYFFIGPSGQVPHCGSSMAMAAAAAHPSLF